MALANESILASWKVVDAVSVTSPIRYISVLHNVVLCLRPSGRVVWLNTPEGGSCSVPLFDCDTYDVRRKSGRRSSLCSLLLSSVLGHSVRFQVSEVNRNELVLSTNDWAVLRCRRVHTQSQPHDSDSTAGVSYGRFSLRQLLYADTAAPDCHLVAACGTSVAVHRVVLHLHAPQLAWHSQPLRHLTAPQLRLLVHFMYCECVPPDTAESLAASCRTALRQLPVDVDLFRRLAAACDRYCALTALRRRVEAAATGATNSLQSVVDCLHVDDSGGGELSVDSMRRVTACGVRCGVFVCRMLCFCDGGWRCLSAVEQRRVCEFIRRRLVWTLRRLRILLQSTHRRLQLSAITGHGQLQLLAGVGSFLKWLIPVFNSVLHCLPGVSEETVASRDPTHLTDALRHRRERQLSSAAAWLQRLAAKTAECAVFVDARLLSAQPLHTARRVGRLCRSMPALMVRLEHVEASLCDAATGRRALRFLLVSSAARMARAVRVARALGVRQVDELVASVGAVDAGDGELVALVRQLLRPPATPSDVRQDQDDISDVSSSEHPSVECMKEDICEGGTVGCDMCSGLTSPVRAAMSADLDEESDSDGDVGGSDDEAADDSLLLLCDMTRPPLVKCSSLSDKCCRVFCENMHSVLSDRHSFVGGFSWRRSDFIEFVINTNDQRQDQVESDEKYQQPNRQRSNFDVETGQNAAQHVLNVRPHDRHQESKHPGSQSAVDEDCLSLWAPTALLVANWPWLCRLIDSGMCESVERRVRLSAVSSVASRQGDGAGHTAPRCRELLRLMLQFVCCHQLPAAVSTSQLLELLQLSDCYQLPRLHELCVRRLSRRPHLSERCVLAVLLAAETSNAPRLRRAALDFISTHAEQLTDRYDAADDWESELSRLPDDLHSSVCNVLRDARVRTATVRGRRKGSTWRVDYKHDHVYTEQQIRELLTPLCRLDHDDDDDQDSPSEGCERAVTPVSQQGSEQEAGEMMRGRVSRVLGVCGRDVEVSCVVRMLLVADYDVERAITLVVGATF